MVIANTAMRTSSTALVTLRTHDGICRDIHTLQTKERKRRMEKQSTRLKLGHFRTDIRLVFVRSAYAADEILSYKWKTAAYCSVLRMLENRCFDSWFPS